MMKFSMNNIKKFVIISKKIRFCLIGNIILIYDENINFMNKKCNISI